MQYLQSMVRLSKSQYVSAALLGAIFIFAVYRAVTQSLTIDESTTFNLYVKDAPAALFSLPVYRANHHVLHSIGAWLSVSAFGFSEWSLRLPALLGGLLFLFASYRVLRQMAVSGWRLPLACAALWLNPIVLDHLVKARGYGMALAFSTLALQGLLRWRPSGERANRELCLVSVWLGLAAASNLVFAVWGGALLASCWMLSARSRDRWRAPHYAVAVFPCGLIAGSLVLVPLRKMQNLRYGATSWHDSLRSLVDSTLHHSGESWSETALLSIGAVVLGLVVVSVCVRRMRHSVLIAVALMTACLTYAVAHLFMEDLRLPMHRTGLYLIVGVTFLVAAGSCAAPAGKTVSRWIGRGLTVVLLALVISHATELSASRFRSGSHDASARMVFEKLHALHRSSGLDRPLSVGTFGWFYDSTLNAYREMEQADWLLHVKRERIPASHHDFVVVADEVWHLAKSYCVLVKRYPVAQTRLVRFAR